MGPMAKLHPSAEQRSNAQADCQNIDKLIHDAFLGPGARIVPMTDDELKADPPRERR